MLRSVFALAIVTTVAACGTFLGLSGDDDAPPAPSSSDGEGGAGGEASTAEGGAGGDGGAPGEGGPVPVPDAAPPGQWICASGNNAPAGPSFR